MMKISALFFWCILTQSLLAQSFELPEDGFFNPSRDPVAHKIQDRLKLLFPEAVLVRAVAGPFPRMGMVEKVECQAIEDYWWLTIQSRLTDDLDQSIFVAVRLKPDGAGRYFADAYWTACTGEGCGGCDFKLQMDGCFCRFDKPGEPGIPGACYQTSSDEMLLVKVPLK